MADGREHPLGSLSSALEMFKAVVTQHSSNLSTRPRSTEREKEINIPFLPRFFSTLPAAPRLVAALGMLSMRKRLVLLNGRNLADAACFQEKVGCMLRRVGGIAPRTGQGSVARWCGSLGAGGDGSQVQLRWATRDN